VFDGVDSPAARRACPSDLWHVAWRKLDQINRVRELSELAVPPGISKTNCSISGDTSRIIARTPHWNAERLAKRRLYSYDQSPICTATDGDLTAEASITHLWLPDYPKDQCSLRHPANIGDLHFPKKPAAV
jgi:hypothetical protein